MADLIGQDIGRYHIVEHLGEGGMATVYQAFDTRLERDVAIKVIRKDAFPANMHAHVFKRFEREAKALARLSHPNIVKIHDYGDYEGSPFLVMEYIPGGTLKSRMGTPFNTGEAVRLLLPIAQALEYAHEHDIIHRDVKPANILLSEKGQPVLSDFGIAKILESDEGNTLTGTGVGIGTPEYMAPEQCLGEEVDSRTDIYALGIVFYEMVAGRKPYLANTPMAVIHKQISDPLPSPGSFVTGLPKGVERVIFKALAKRPQDRYASMGEFAAALEKLLSEVNTRQAPQPVLTRAGKVPQSVSESPAAASPQKSPDVTTDTGQPVSPPFKAVKRSSIPAWATILVGCILVFLMVGGVLLSQKAASQSYAPSPTIINAAIPLFTQTTVPTSAITAVALPTATVAAPAAVKVVTPTMATVIVDTPTKAPGIGSSRISDKDGMKLMYVPAGKFQMGSKDFSEAQPHTVNLDAFWIDQTDVTNAMYAKCVSAGSCKSSTSSSDSKFNGNQQPVVGVDWSQADAYCKWAGRSLPTEAQWEKAARGTDGRTYPWGNQLPDKSLLNYNSNLGKTTDVGSYPSGASPYGALDMAGNVWQWVADWYDPNYYQNSPQNNPTGPSSGKYRSLHGGSWDDNNVYYSFSAYRYFYNPSYLSDYFGFRCAVSAAP